MPTGNMGRRERGVGGGCGKDAESVTGDGASPSNGSTNARNRKPPSLLWTELPVRQSVWLKLHLSCPFIVVGVDRATCPPVCVAEASPVLPVRRGSCGQSYLSASLCG